MWYNAPCAWRNDTKRRGQHPADIPYKYMAVAVTTFITYTLLFAALYFEVFLLLSFLLRHGLKRPQIMPARRHSSLPTVAIVVPCYNEERTVARTIESLLNLEYPKEKIEIIVVDDGSKDATYEVASRYEEAGVRILRKENGGKHSALNLALLNTNSEIIGCLDADSSVEPDALMRIAESFENTSVSAVTPGIHVREPRTILEHIQTAEYRLSVFIRNALASVGSIFITPGPFSIFRSSVVRKLGGWRHGHSTEDLELGLRLQERGYTILNNPAATVWTAAPRTLKALFRQRIRWTYGFLRNTADYHFMIGNPRYGNLGLMILPTALLSIFAAIYFAAVLIFSAANSAFEAYIRLVASGWNIALDPLAFSASVYSTSFAIFLVYFAIAIVMGLIAIGSFISLGKHRLPASAFLFILIYSFIVPLWLSAAVVRAALKTGVAWR